MSLKIFLLFTILTILSHSYTQEQHVLVLSDDDFPSILSQFQYILIQFYAPWCGHCKKLAPIYIQVAKQLHSSNSSLKLAKVDATKNSASSKTYSVKGYPTLIFFKNGQQIPYTGQRSKIQMINWLNKRIRQPVSQIDLSTYKSLKDSSSVSIIYHGNFIQQPHAQILNKHSSSDDNNQYHWGIDLGLNAGTVQLLRNFDQDVTYHGIDQGLITWIKKNQRPFIKPFDQRTIADIFHSKQRGAILFNPNNSQLLLISFTQAAKKYESSSNQPLIFSQLPKQNQHFNGLSQYIKIQNIQATLVIIDTSAQKKYVFKGQPTVDNLFSFLENHQNDKYGLTDQVQQKEIQKLQEL